MASLLLTGIRDMTILASSTSSDRTTCRHGPRHIAIVGVPIDIGASQPGAIMGPAALRTAGIVESLRALGHEVVDQGDLPAPAPVQLYLPHAPDKARNLTQIAAWSRALSQCTYDIARAGACPVLLGGDHSLSMGSVNGIARHAKEIGRATWPTAFIDTISFRRASCRARCASVHILSPIQTTMVTAGSDRDQPDRPTQTGSQARAWPELLSQCSL